jgi:hypothetical protein
LPWPIPIIPVTWEIEIGRIDIQIRVRVIGDWGDRIGWAHTRPGK